MIPKETIALWRAELSKPDADWTAWQTVVRALLSERDDLIALLRAVGFSSFRRAGDHVDVKLTEALRERLVAFLASAPENHSRDFEGSDGGPLPRKDRP